jgi:hypothetical protein
MANAAVQKNVKKAPKATELLLVFICALALPLSMIMWIGNLAFSFFTGGANAIHHEGKNVFSFFFKYSSVVLYIVLDISIMKIIYNVKDQLMYCIGFIRFVTSDVMIFMSNDLTC